MSINNTNNFLPLLANNIGRVVTVFCKCGGASGCGFTGLLVRVDCDFIKLTTSIPCAPSNPFGLFINSGNAASNRRCGNEFGTSCIIPTDAIVSFVFNEL